MNSMQPTRRVDRSETSFTSCTSHTFSALCLENPLKMKGGSLSTRPTVKSNLAHTANNMAVTWSMPAYTTCASNICYSCRTTQCFTWTGKKKRSNINLNYPWDVLMCWRLVWQLDLVLSQYCCVLMQSQKMPFFFVFVFYLCQEERDVQRASSCGRRCSCSLRQTAGICLWRWCHWEPRWLCWCCLHYKLWWPAKEAELKNMHLLAGTSCCFHVYPTSWPAERSYLIPVFYRDDIMPPK